MNNYTIKNTITSVAAFVAVCFAGSAAYAGPTEAPAKKIIEVAQESCITGDIGFDVVSELIQKGIVKQNQGFIMQPYVDLHFRIYKGAGALTSITADIGMWNSLQDYHPKAARGNTVPDWFQMQFYSGLTFNFDKLSLGSYYRLYENPENSLPAGVYPAFTLGFVANYDDSTKLGIFALHPHLFVELELSGTTGNDVIASNPSFHGRGQYYEIGIAPQHKWGDFTLSLPVTAGFGSGGFYLGGRGFGFIAAGIDANYALSFIPACLGKWSLSSSFSYYRLGGDNNPRALSGASGHSLIGFTDNNQLVFQGGLKVAF
jgi:hypothetical protein